MANDAKGLAVLWGQDVNTTKLHDWLQIIGLFAVVASLVFVGLEMRQAQKISMSQTYQSRTAAVVEWQTAFAANPVALSAYRKAMNGNDDEIAAAEQDALHRTLMGLYYLYDNAHYQYQEGFVSAEFWASTRKSLYRVMETPAVNEIFSEFSGRAGRPEFRSLVQEISAQIEAQVGD